eukprot:COSAG06_NODE_10498_length_1667_cov_2.050286_2_plen_147_part_00
MAGLAKSRAVLVTGASSGIGLACCRLLASRGWRVALADVNVDDGEKAAAEIRAQHAGSDAVFYPLDVCDEAQTEDTVAAVVDQYGSIDGAIANAGVVFQKPFLETTTEEYTRVINTNLVVRAAILKPTCSPAANNCSCCRCDHLAA